MDDQYSRLKLLIGEDGLQALKTSRIAVFGAGGVGGYAIEALARSGIGTLDIIDADTIDITNLNRQIIATHDTIGAAKVDVIKDRILSIAPDIIVNTYQLFYLPEYANKFNFLCYDYIVDAVDTISAKIDIIVRAKEADIPVISAMGCGNRLDPTKLTVTDIYKTSIDPLAKVMRRELKKRGVDNLTVVYSTEPPIIHSNPPGSTAFVPAAAGLIIASRVTTDIVSKNTPKDA